MAKEKINRLKIVLTELGMTQKALAKKLGVTEHTISRICTNDTQPSLRRLKAIAGILEIDIRELLIPTPSVRRLRAATPGENEPVEVEVGSFEDGWEEKQRVEETSSS